MNSPLESRKVRLRGLRLRGVLGVAVAVASFAVPEDARGQAASADSVSVVGMRVEPDTVTVGQPFRAAVFVRAPAGARLALAVAPAADGAYQSVGEVRAYPADSAGVHRAVASMVMWITDPAASARAEARVTLPGGAVRVIPLQLPLPAVRATLPADSTQPRPPKDIVPTPRRAARWPWIAAAALVALALLAFWLWRRRRRPADGAPRDARGHALAELDRLRASGMAEREPEAFSAATGAVLRDFAAAVDPALSPDLTTSEVLARLAETGARADDVAVIQAALSGADLAKFARRRPTTERALEDWAAARRWVQGYRAAAAPEPVEGGAMTAGFAHPWAIMLLLLVPLWWRSLRRGRPRALAFAPAGAVGDAARGQGRWLGAVPDVLRGASFALLVLALAGPRTGARMVEEQSEGIAIVLAVDVSQSMLAEDLRPRNRLGAAKQTVARFIQGRDHDRIALVAFAAEAMTRVPLTRDYAVLAEAVGALQSGGLGEGTAIGDGLAAAAARLRSAPERSKVVVLMSDGANNRGEIDPRQAARAAAVLGIRVYTIAMGSDTVARVPVAITRVGPRYALARTVVDERLLADVAGQTGGRYYRARDTDALRRIYADIDRLERTPVRTRRYLRTHDWYLPFLLAGAVMLLAEWLFRATRWGRVP